jgi:UrcA family protein
MNTLTRTVFPTHLALLSFAATIIGPHAVVHAADRSHVAERSLKVSFADLNLRNRQGTVTLYTRIRNAARTVCGPAPDISFGDDRADWSRCVNDAIADAVAKAGDANLTDYYLVKTNRSNTSVARR